jgi:hypothetical protein
VRLCAARESLGRHLQHEETEAIAILQRVLTNEEWEQIEETHFKKDLAFAQILAIVPWCAHGVPGPLRRQVLSKTGRANHILWLLTRRGFEQREAVAFRYVD